MAKDFYLNERALASYLEKDWADHFTDWQSESSKQFAFKPFDRSRLYCAYHEKLVEVIANQALKLSFRPVKVLEVGSSLGRTFFEVCQRFETLRSACLVEPSQNLHGAFQKIFKGKGQQSFSTLKGNAETHIRAISTAPIQALCAHVDWTCLNSSFQTLNCAKEAFDLVICSNVIDQCHEPLELIRFLKSSTAKNGLLVLSCTYQWQDKYLGNAGVIIQNITDLFLHDWHLVHEIDIPFYFRVNERYWMSFLSHAGCFVKR